MPTGSGKEYHLSFSTNNQPFKMILLPEQVNNITKKKQTNNYIDFDEASKLWRKNKIYLGYGIFKYKQ